jgi:hypothetical protein
MKYVVSSCVRVSRDPQLERVLFLNYPIFNIQNKKFKRKKFSAMHCFSHGGSLGAPGLNGVEIHEDSFITVEAFLRELYEIHDKCIYIYKVDGRCH